MCNYLIGRSAKPKKTFHYSLESIQKAGGVLTPLTALNLKRYADLSEKHFSIEKLRPYADRLFYSEIYKNPTLLLDKTKPIFNRNGSNQYWIVEGITDVLNLITYGYDNDYGIIFRYNVGCLPDIPAAAGRLIFISDNDESQDDLIQRIINKYDKELFKKIAFYQFSMDKTGFKDSSDINFKDISEFNDNSEIESNEELIEYIIANKTHLNKELLRASKTKEVY